jgi:hypothetical protein
LYRQLSKEKAQMANKYMKKCSTSLAVKVLQIKMTLRSNFTPVHHQENEHQVLVKILGKMNSYTLLMGNIN